jgi:hypothetical protein
MPRQPMPIIVYISGPMQGYERWNEEAFNLLAAELRAAGHIVYNPAEVPCTPEVRKTLPRSYWMRRDAHYILQADILIQMEGWENSEGALWEVDFARKLGLTVYHNEAYARAELLRGSEDA